jgi:hypothetical protein
MRSRTSSIAIAAGALLAGTNCGGTDLTVSGQSLGPILWNGIDARPLAVGSELRVTFTSLDLTACCQSGYEVQSLEPSILSVQDLGGQQIALDGLAPGFVEVQVLSPSQVVGRLGVAVRAPTQIALSDPSHLAAGIEVPLPLPGFDIRAQGLELLTVQVLDDQNEALAFSVPLLAINVSGLIEVAPQSGTTLAVAGQESGQQGCFDVELVVPNPLPSMAFSCMAIPPSHNGWPIYQVTVLEGPASVTIRTRDLATTPERVLDALAIAYAADGITEVLGADPWTFTLAGQGTLIPIAPAAARLIFPSGTQQGASSVTASNGANNGHLAVPP